MNKSTFAAAIATFAAVSFAALAPAHAAQVMRDDGATGTVNISAASGYKPTEAEFNDYVSAYRFDNGAVLKFSQTLSRYYVELKNERLVRLHPVAKGVFVTDAGTRVEFRNDGEQVAIVNMERLPKMAKHAVEGRIYVAAR